MAEKLTGDPSIGIGELTADDDPIHLRRIKLAAGIVPWRRRSRMSLWVPSSRVWKLAGSSASMSLQKSKTSQRSDLKNNIGRGEKVRYP
jgi:hypothetical protein